MTIDPILVDLAPIEEGLKCDLIDWIFGDEFPLNQLSEITLVVVSQRSTRMIIEKKLSTGGIVVVGQTLTVPLLPADTRTHAGTFVYAMDFIDAEGYAIATARGKGIINAELNPS